MSQLASHNPAVSNYQATQRDVLDQVWVRCLAQENQQPLGHDQTLTISKATVLPIYLLMFISVPVTFEQISGAMVKNI